MPPSCASDSTPDRNPRAPTACSNWGFGQDELVQAVAAANPKTIVVLTAGGSVDVTKWIDRVPAFLHGWYSGQEAGRALPKVLFGEVNPSGRLPISFERAWADNPVHDSYYANAPGNTVIYKEGVFMGYRGYEHNGVKPLFPFGHGLSYTTFAFKNLSSPPRRREGRRERDGVIRCHEHRNARRRRGAAALSRQSDRQRAAPGEGTEGILPRRAAARRNPAACTLTLDPRAMSFFDVTSHAWKQEPGKFTVLVGHSSADIDLQGEYTVAP